MSGAPPQTTRNHVPRKARRDECRNMWVHEKGKKRGITPKGRMDGKFINQDVYVK